MKLNDEQIERYGRNIILKEVGGSGQERLLESKVLIIGAGGLGSPAALYLAAAGVGTIGIVDGDRVDLSNLQRQIIHFTGDVGERKTESAKEKIEFLNPDVRVKTYDEIATSNNILDIIHDYDFIVDGTDNFPAKFLINDACVMSGRPFSHAGILMFYGQTITVLPHESACFRCLFLGPPPPGSVPSCREAGILGGVAGLFGTIQAVEALKYILGTGGLLAGRLLTVDTLTMSFREIKVKKNPRCPVCGENPAITSLVDYEQEACNLKI
ncbi:MAG: adenylyltransferase [Spirochaetes bacterium RBG_13_51_14]|nr:MAG: adenylyltransferase [Spirochaetes bacterium RBG_13_51_14]